MNFDKISSFAMAGNLDRLNHWVQVATSKVLWESRASAWGSPRFWPENEPKHNKTHNESKEVRR